MAKVNDILQNVRIMAGTPYALAFPAADAAGALTSNGSGALSFAVAANTMELLHCSTGSNTTTSANNFATYAFSAGALNAKDSIIVKWALTVTGATLIDPILWSETDSAQIGNISENNIGAGSNGGLASMSIITAEPTKVLAAPNGSNALASLHTVSTAWTAEWTLALRGQNGSGGTTKWQWAVYALRGV